MSGFPPSTSILYCSTSQTPFPPPPPNHTNTTTSSCSGHHRVLLQTRPDQQRGGRALPADREPEPCVGPVASALRLLGQRKGQGLGRGRGRSPHSHPCARGESSTGSIPCFFLVSILYLTFHLALSSVLLFVLVLVVILTNTLLVLVVLVVVLT